MKILVTGGAGFVGSALCKELSKQHEVWSLDNYSSGHEYNHHESVNYVHGDTRDIQFLIDFKPDLVYHLGEYARVEQSFEEPRKVWEYNSHGTFEVLEFCRKHKCKIVYSGSSTKFSNESKSLSPYAFFKATNTELIEKYANWYDIDYAIAYFYSVYGPGQITKGKYATVIGVFETQYYNNEPLTVVSPGTQTRAFTHIDDTVSGLILVGENGHGPDYGIGTTEEYSILDVAKMFGSPIKMLPERKGNRLATGKVMNQKLLDLGWEPKISIKDYIHACRSR